MGSKICPVCRTYMNAEGYCSKCAGEETATVKKTKLGKSHYPAFGDLQKFVERNHDIIQIISVQIVPKEQFNEYVIFYLVEE